MTVGLFVAVVVLWGVFGAALLLCREGLDIAWRAFRTASLPVQAVGRVVLLQSVLSLAVWPRHSELRPVTTASRSGTRPSPEHRRSTRPPGTSLAGICTCAG
jgi:hypothetical protein